MPARTRPNASKCEHLDRKHYARGLCKSCFYRSKRPTRNAKLLKKNGEGYFRNQYLRYKYGITKAEQDAMFVAQSGKCAICKNYMTPTKPHTGTSISVDHDHVTGVVRGLLCHYCNAGLGYFKDSIANLDAAKAYLGDKQCLPR